MMNMSRVKSKRCCPNCGTVETGCRDEHGVLRLTCRCCGTYLVSRPRGRRHENMDVYAPKGEMLAEYYLADMEDDYGLYE